MLATILSAAVTGLESAIIEVQVDVSAGFPSFTIVGLPDTAIQESRERIRSAIRHAGWSFPDSKVIVNLAPADLPKVGPSYDLPIALAVLVAHKTIALDYDAPELKSTLCIGEMSLDGQIRPVTGALPVTLMAKQRGFTTIVLPQANAIEAALVPDITVVPVKTLRDIVLHFQGEKIITPQPHQPPQASLVETPYDFAYIKGQQVMKRALEIVAAGGHHILLYGPPGAGKTILANSLLSILPTMTISEMLEVTQLYSIAGLLSVERSYIRERPFRHPHHSASMAALVGGGRLPRPGEISLAHHGVLYLDELPEFSRSVLEALRQPLEERTVTVARVEQSVTYPAHSILVGSLNPCPCGYAGDDQKECLCTPTQLSNYQKKLSGPLLDRIDLFCYVPRVAFDTLTNEQPEESSSAVRQRVEQAVLVQRERYKQYPRVKNNAALPNHLLNKYCQLDLVSKRLVKQAVETMHLSPRTYHSILRVARTIADLNQAEHIGIQHLSEALQYRQATITTHSP